jgi:uncharacterized membrane protein YfcA
MLFGIPVGELVLLAIAILVAGIVSGLLAGLFGIGGSTVVIPVLYEVFRILEVPDSVRMQLSIGTALAVTVPTTVRAYFAHRAKGAVLDDALRIWAIPAALGRESWRVGDALPGRPTMIAAGISFGFLATLVGIAGGSLSTLFLTLYGVPFHLAVATSSGLGVFIGIPASVGYMIAGWPHQALMPPLSIGFVSILSFLLIAPAGVLAAPYGARLAHKLSKRKLEIAFGLFLLLVAVRFAASLVVA